jgi:hypothetical protein
MPTIFSFRGLRVVIYVNDHHPPHVHVIGPRREAKIALGDERGHPWLITNDGLSRRQVAIALLKIRDSRDLLIQRWREIHGDA